MNDLSALLEECQPAIATRKPNLDLLGMARELKLLGFTRIAKDINTGILRDEKLEDVAHHKYLVLTPEKIRAFLERASTAYNLSWETTRGLFVPKRQSGGTARFFSPTCHFMCADPTKINCFSWVETPIKDYETIPPRRVLDALREHRSREIFDEFLVASIDHMRDPFLLGRIEGSEDRYFIAAWGDEALDDVI